MSNRITEELMPALEGAIPAIMATTSRDGVPNATYVWQVFPVDEKHVAVSRQFLNKTAHNLEENPAACFLVTHPKTYLLYKLSVTYVGSQHEGPLYETIALQADVIAGASTRNTFNLVSVDIFEIVRIERIDLT